MCCTIYSDSQFNLEQSAWPFSHSGSFEIMQTSFPHVCSRSDHDPSRFNRIPVCVPSLCIPPWEIVLLRHIRVCVWRIWNVNYFDSRGSRYFVLKPFYIPQRVSLAATVPVSRDAENRNEGDHQEGEAERVDVFTTLKHSNVKVIIMIRTKIHYPVDYIFCHYRN